MYQKMKETIMSYLKLEDQEVLMINFNNLHLTFTKKKLCLDIVKNSNEREYADIWKLRDGTSETLGKMGYALKYDLSLPP